MPPSTPDAPPTDESLRFLASLVAECRGVTSKFSRLGDLPARDEAPFLYRQLDQVLRDLRGATSAALETTAGKEEEREQGGFFGKLRRSLMGSDDGEAGADGGEEKGHPEDGLQGNSWTIPIPDLIGFLATARKSGVLWVHAPNETFMLEIRDGNLLHAASDHTPPGQRLGEVLVEQGTLTEEALEEFLANQEEPGMLGAELVRSGLVDDAQLRAALSVQVQGLFGRLLNATEAIFRFQEGHSLLVERTLQANVTQLMLESARLNDESGLGALTSLLDGE